MNDTGQNLATNGDARRAPRSRLVKRLLALEVGESFPLDIARKKTMGGHMTRWGERTGRRFSMRRMLRTDGEVRQVLVKRVA